MKYLKMTFFGVLISFILLFFVLNTQVHSSTLEQIIIYKGKIAGTGPGITSFKLTVDEEITLTAKGVDKDGNDVAIWPTWKADKELSITVMEGRSKTVIVKALKTGAPIFISALYITDDGKKVKGEVMGEVKEKE